MVPYNETIQKLAHAFEVPPETFHHTIPDHRLAPRILQEEPKSTFGKLISQARIKKGWTQKQAALLLGITNLNVYEQRAIPQERNKVLQIAQMFDIDQDRLLAAWNSDSAETLPCEHCGDRFFLKEFEYSGKLRSVLWCGDCRTNFHDSYVRKRNTAKQMTWWRHNKEKASVLSRQYRERKKHASSSIDTEESEQ